MKFLGLKNYIRIFQDEAAMESFRRTLSWTLLNTPLWLSLSFLLAYILNHATRGKGVFRTLYYLPSVVPLVGVRWVGNVFFNQSFGLINQVISVFRPGTAIQWLTEYALFSLTSLAVWTGLGAGVVVFLAALQDIPTELKEAAVIDGVSKLQVFRHVIIPLTTPVIFYQLVLSLSVALQYYALPMLLAPNNVSNAGTLSTPPARNAYLFMVHSIRQAFGYQRYGYATALNWFLVLVIAAFTGFLFWTAPKWVHYETEVQV